MSNYVSYVYVYLVFGSSFLILNFIISVCGFWNFIFGVDMGMGVGV